VRVARIDGADPLGLRRSSPAKTPAAAPETAAAKAAKDQLVRFGTKWLDLEAQALRDDEGNEHPLTASEFGLLKVFAANPKRVLSRERLLELANARDSEAFDRAVDLRIMRIRRKIELDPTKARGDPYYPRRRIPVFACGREGVASSRLRAGTHGHRCFIVRGTAAPAWRNTTFRDYGSRLKAGTTPVLVSATSPPILRSLKSFAFHPECFVVVAATKQFSWHETIFRLARRHPETFAD